MPSPHRDPAGPAGRRRARDARLAVAAALLAAPGLAAAHGEEIALLPVGNAAALLVVLVAGFVARADWPSRLLALLVAVAVSLPPYFATNRYVPYWVSFSEAAWFLVGFVPPTLLAGAFLAWRWRARRRGSP